MSDSPDTPMHQCTGECKCVLPFTSEFFYTRSPRGLSLQCKECQKARALTRYKETHPVIDRTEEQFAELHKRRSDAQRNSEKARTNLKRLADSRRGKPRPPLANPELHSANLSKAQRGKHRNLGKSRGVKFQPEVRPIIQVDLPVFDGCEPKDCAEIDEVMSVYVIINTATGQMYIGSATNTRRRWYMHRSHLNKGMHHAIYLQRAWNKYGASVFSFRLIEIVDVAANLTIREQYWIDLYRTADYRYGYNASPTAISPLGVRHTPEACANMKASQHRMCKITDSDFFAIVDKLSQGHSVSSIAQDYSVSATTIYCIKRGKHWKCATLSDDDI